MSDAENQQALQGAVDRCIRALERYGVHLEECARYGTDPISENIHCTCGLSALIGDGPFPHSDDLAVDRFAIALKAKMAKKRSEGRGGWDDETQCHVNELARMLVSHIAKGDPVDIGNFAMMLFNRKGGAEAIRIATQMGEP